MFEFNQHECIGWKRKRLGTTNTTLRWLIYHKLKCKEHLTPPVQLNHCRFFKENNINFEFFSLGFGLVGGGFFFLGWVFFFWGSRGGHHLHPRLVYSLRDLVYCPYRKERQYYDLRPNLITLLCQSVNHLPLNYGWTFSCQAYKIFKILLSAL